MIGVDTNVLLRAVVGDDPKQSLQARNFFSQRSTDDPAYVCLVVLVEFIWSLRRSYRYSDAQTIEAVRRLESASDVVLEKRDVVERCLTSAVSGQGLADLLVAFGNLAAGCTHTVTFDEEAAKLIRGMEQLE